MGERLTKRELVALDYMDTCMWSSAASVGYEVYHACKFLGGGSNVISIGATVLGRLKKRGLVRFYDAEKFWRITPAGRSALQDQEKVK
jgi:hypothetical protein